MTIDPDKVKDIAQAYTAAWNSGSPEAVAEFYAQDGQIAINRGNPWEVAVALPKWPPASLPMCRTSHLFATKCAAPTITLSIFGPLRAPILEQRTPFALPDGKSGISMRTSK